MRSPGTETTAASVRPQRPPLAGTLAWLVGSAAVLDRAVVARYDDRTALGICAAWRPLGRLWGSAEVWLGFWLLGQPIGVAEAVM